MKADRGSVVTPAADGANGLGAESHICLDADRIKDFLEPGDRYSLVVILSPSLMFCPTTGPDREDNDAGQHAAHRGEHPVCSGG
jgi:hypothetical protein